jgi:hypothetical protein
MGSGGIAPCIINFDIRVEIPASRAGRFNPGKNPRYYPLDRRLADPRAGFDVVLRRKPLLLLVVKRWSRDPQLAD